MPGPMTTAWASKPSAPTSPTEVQAALHGAGAPTVAWYGVRLFTDHWGPEHPGEDFAAILAAEEEAGCRDPFRSLAALTHTIARREDVGC